jgi:hypothetical protein
MSLTAHADSSMRLLANRTRETGHRLAGFLSPLGTLAA